MRCFLSVFIFLISFVSLIAQTKSPKDFLGYELGTRFTHYHKIVDYFDHVAKNNENVTFVSYGETYEHRPLKLAFITAPKNFSKLEELRKNHLINANILKGEKTEEEIAIVWLSYNVHGNEAVSSEASMMTLFELVNPNNQKTKAWLENTIVIMDPCLNPDGRDRYVNWYTQNKNYPYNPNLDSKEHREPHPNGRSNHYLFDLNRDWAWITQKESQARIKVYNEWLPNIHVDFHEQGINENYYFAPAAEPYHEVITDFQRAFQKTIGENHASYFDKEGWLYFTKELFDLYYPSYGDTYPTYNGSIGMTYEQAGSGRAGLGVHIEDGTLLTLKDRILHQHTTGISTIEIASEKAKELCEEFAKYFNEDKKFKYNSYVISGENEKDKISSLRTFLDKHIIQYGNPTNESTINALNFDDQQSRNYKVKNNDLIINLNQPKARLIKALFEPYAKVPDSLTYDITAWSLPYARGLKAYASDKSISVKDYIAAKTQNKSTTTGNAYAYLAKWNSLDDASFLAELLQYNVKVRYAKRPFKIEGGLYDAGTLVITRAGNDRDTTFKSIIPQIAKKHNRELVTVQSGMVSQGSDFGSGKLEFIQKPRIAVLRGDTVSSLGFGAVWHFFEQQLGYPITVIDTDYFSRINLNKYNVLVLPSGYYGDILDKDGMSELQSWIRGGGKLIVLDRAVSTFANNESFSLTQRKPKKDKGEKAAPKEQIKYADRERHRLSDLNTGAIFKVVLDETNPLAFGYTDYYTLKLNSSNYPLLNGGQNVAYIKDKEALLNGFSGVNVQSKIDNTLVFGVESKGRGNIIYLVDDPLFRSFWENGKLLFSNAVFIVK